MTMKRSGIGSMLRRLVWFFNRPDTPSFAPDLRVPLWKSILIDWGCLFSFGLWKPNARLDLQEEAKHDA